MFHNIFLDKITKGIFLSREDVGLWHYVITCFTFSTNITPSKEINSILKHPYQNNVI